MSVSRNVDYVVIGGGFYGCCLALFLRSLTDRIILVEAGERLLDRASRVNQARVHTGFHYPRSALTAVKSMVLHRRFAADFPDAIVSDFQMLYAIARRRSKVSANRFHRMFEDMGAPIVPASPMQMALFNPDMIEAAFACTEYAFDYSVLRRHLANRLDALDMEVRFQTQVCAVKEQEDHALVQLSDGSTLRARFVFNVTYSGINMILRSAGLPEAQLKHELTEIALIRPPEHLEGYGVTVMDGPFFSAMPYPADNLYSLTHVRYTPHDSWTDRPDQTLRHNPPSEDTLESRARYMILDSQRYMPCLAKAEWRRSLFEIKTVLLKNERDDGRPILFQRQPENSRTISIMGGKIDNIYDLFDLIKGTEPEWACGTDLFVRSVETV